MEKLAAVFGTFLGYAIGSALKIAGPELREFLKGIVTDALKGILEDKADVSRSGDIDATGDVGVRASSADHPAWPQGSIE